MGKASRDKGKRGEREARNRIAELWKCPDCRRSAQVDGGLTADLVGGPSGLHLEVKRLAKIAVERHLEQAERDTDTDLPVVLMRADEGHWMLLVRLEDSERFARTLVAHLDD